MSRTTSACPVSPGLASKAPSTGTDNEALSRSLAEHIGAAEFPCVGAKAALSQGGLRCVTLGRLGDRANDALLLDALEGFAAELDQLDGEDLTLHSLAAVFDGPDDTDEQRFEALLWSQLQRLHALDVRRGHGWSPDVGRDPDAPDFSLSLAGHPFFVIGLHSGASRIARRLPNPAMVFNSHSQFDRLRADGRYERMQKAIRQRDTELQGSINPNLADFGTAPETRQYSGRAVEKDWRCPFHAMQPTRKK